VVGAGLENRAATVLENASADCGLPETRISRYANLKC
jgi:hypothetical protein